MNISSGHSSNPPAPSADRDTSANSHLAQCLIKIGGSDLHADIMKDVIEVSVENSMFMPDSCLIRVNDTTVKHVDASEFFIGKAVEISMGANPREIDKVFKGEIVGLDADFAAHGMTSFTVRCLNKGHRLHRDRKRKTFLQVKASDIVSKVASENGLSSEVDSVGPVHEYICQNNQTDWEFLREIADRNDCRLYVSDEKLKLKKVDQHQDMVKVQWGEELRSFRPRITSAGQVDEAVVKGWDPSQKKEIIATKTTVIGDQQTGIGKSGGATSKSAFGSSKQVVVDRPVKTTAEAEQMAQSIIDTRQTRFIEADGLCTGNPKIMSGTKVDVAKVGTRLTGKYNVTATVHTYTPAEGYTTQFICSGKDPHSLLGLIDGERREESNIGGNIVIGIVTDNKDPENQGRMKVKFPWFEDNLESTWCRLVSPMAGKDRGFLFLPEVDDEVLVAFEHGDITRPFVLGALWNGKDAPPKKSDEVVPSGGVDRRLIKTRVGHIIMLDDSSDKCQVFVQTKAGHIINLDDANSKIEVIDKTGSNKMTIDSSANSIKLECAGNYDVDAKGKVTIKGQQGILLDTPQSLEGKGMKVAFEAQTTAELKGTASVTVQSSGQTSIKGTMVMIN